jgi:hypothetical protein
MGFATYYLLPLPGEPPVANTVPLHASGPNVTLSNGIVSLEFDTASGLLKSWTDFASQTTTAFTQVCVALLVLLSRMHDLPASVELLCATVAGPDVVQLQRWKRGRNGQLWRIRLPP